MFDIQLISINDGNTTICLNTNEAKVVNWLKTNYPTTLEVSDKGYTLTFPQAQTDVFLKSLQKEFSEKQGYKNVIKNFVASALPQMVSSNAMEVVEGGISHKGLEIKSEKRAASDILPEESSLPARKKNIDSLEEALRNKEPKLLFTFCEKNSRKITHESRSGFSVRRSDGHIINFKIEHDPDKRYPKGACAGRVKKGFIGDELDPKFAVKIFGKDTFFSSGGKVREIRVAARATVCLKVLGRTGDIFRRNGKQYLITDWHPGATLGSVSKDSLKQRPIQERIKLALQLIRQVAILHKNGIIHCDIKPKNLILSETSLTLIDFDSARYKDEKSAQDKKAIFTLAFLNTYLNWELRNGNYNIFSEQSDMHALGLTLGFLFPELFNPVYRQHSTPISPDSSEMFTHPIVRFGIRPEDQPAEHKALAKLLPELMTQNDAMAITIDTYFEKFSELYCGQYQQEFPEELDLKNIEPRALYGKAEFDKIDIEIEEYEQVVRASHSAAAEKITQCRV